MKRRTILPCWCVRLIAGGEIHEVVQTGVRNQDKAEARIRRYFIAERGQFVQRFLSMERMNEQEADAWIKADDRWGNTQKVEPPTAGRLRLRRTNT